MNLENKIEILKGNINEDYIKFIDICVKILGSKFNSKYSNLLKKIKGEYISYFNKSEEIELNNYINEEEMKLIRKLKKEEEGLSEEEIKLRNDIINIYKEIVLKKYILFKETKEILNFLTILTEKEYSELISDEVIVGYLKKHYKKAKINKKMNKNLKEDILEYSDIYKYNNNYSYSM